jgi:hypothetical protein
MARKTIKAGVKEIKGVGSVEERVLPSVTGGLAMHNFYKVYSEEHPSIRAINTYTKHIGENQLGWAVYVPDSDKGDVFDFQSAWGQRLINKHEAAPIYFAQDWATLAGASTILLVEGKDSPVPSKALLDRRLELLSMRFDEVASLARDMGITKSMGVVTGEKKALAREILRQEYAHEAHWLERLIPAQPHQKNRSG